MYSGNVSQPRARPCIFETKDPPRVRYVSYSRRIFHRGNFLDNLHRLINHHVDHVDEGQGYYNEETSFSSLPSSLSLSTWKRECFLRSGKRSWEFHVATLFALLERLLFPPFCLYISVPFCHVGSGSLGSYPCLETYLASCPKLKQ